jgi:UDP-N-acetylmuramyl tripeptide synthase
MALIKNPVGASETVRMLTDDEGPPLNLMIAINDKIADGTDVSWLWDADFERLNGRVERDVVTGTRARDMAVRLKYAGVEPERIQVEDQLERAIDTAQALTPPGTTLYLLPTYTAMLELRAELHRRGLVGAFWED